MMRKTIGFATTLTAVSLAAALGGCAAQPGNTRSASIFGEKNDQANLALATRAQGALAAGDTATALRLAEQAVENTPNDAGYRALLGNIYFASGRFASAETAYRDSLALLSNQPQLALKMALAEIAQGKLAQARGLLSAARDSLDPSDYGLALALAGDPHEAVAVLDPAARGYGADARIRQNLALAHALSGDWAAARRVAAQDLSPADLDARLQQWMAIASPTQTGSQVASLLGIRPVADAGLPARLALKTDGQAYAMIRAAEGQPVPTAPSAAPAVQVAEAAPMEMPVIDAPAPAPAPVAVAMAAPVAAPPAATPVAVPAASMAMSLNVAAAPVPSLAQAAPAPAKAPAPTPRAKAKVAAAKPAAARPALSPRAASLSVETPGSRLAAAPARAGRSKVVVQLGAYSAKDRVSVGWNRLAGKFAALRGYAPMSARYDLPGGTVYRLSVHGFESRDKAIGLCGAIKRGGGTCFVREVAGDSRFQA